MSMRVYVEPDRRLAQTVMKIVAVDRWTEGDMASVSASRPLLLELERQTFFGSKSDISRTIPDGRVECFPRPFGIGNTRTEHFGEGFAEDLCGCGGGADMVRYWRVE